MLECVLKCSPANIFKYCNDLLQWKFLWFFQTWEKSLEGNSESLVPWNSTPMCVSKPAFPHLLKRLWNNRNPIRIIDRFQGARLHPVNLECIPSNIVTSVEDSSEPGCETRLRANKFPSAEIKVLLLQTFLETKETLKHVKRSRKTSTCKESQRNPHSSRGCRKIEVRTKKTDIRWSQIKEKRTRKKRMTLGDDLHMDRRIETDDKPWIHDHWQRKFLLADVLPTLRRHFLSSTRMAHLKTNRCTREVGYIFKLHFNNFLAICLILRYIYPKNFSRFSSTSLSLTNIT